MDTIKIANLALRFLLELCALAALGYWGFATQSGWPLKLLLGLGAPLLAATVWGVFGSPKALVPLTGPAHLALDMLVFGSGALALIAAGRPGLGGLFALALVANRALIYAWGQ